MSQESSVSMQVYNLSDLPLYNLISPGQNNTFDDPLLVDMLEKGILWKRKLPVGVKTCDKHRKQKLGIHILPCTVAVAVTSLMH